MIRHLPTTCATALLLLAATAARAQSPEPLVSGITIRSITTFDAGSIRVVHDPVSGGLLVALMDGRLYSIPPPFQDTTKTLVATAADHGLTGVQGMAVAADGTLYLSANHQEGNYNVAIIARGNRVGDSGFRWDTLARTEPYPFGNQGFDHTCNGLAVSPDGRFVFMNSGSRTDHGEVQDNGGIFPGMRDVPITSAILRIPADSRNLLIPDNDSALRATGLLFAKGTRNSFDLEFAPNGDLIGTENSGDHDDNEELNWIREGGHYGFPWRLGTTDTPQQYPGYNPENDHRINKSSLGYTKGTFHNDSTYPPRPAGVTFTDPIPNAGPDAVTLRDPDDGSLHTATPAEPLGTFTAHRSPLGLVFDSAGALPADFNGDAYMLSWTDGTPAANDLLTPFSDPGQDMLQLRMRKNGQSYALASRRIVRGFVQPIDAAIVGDRIYVLEWGGAHNLWEVDFSRAGEVRASQSSECTVSAPYPNPAAGETRMSIGVRQAQHVRVELHTMLGARAALLYEGSVESGAPAWLTLDCTSLPSGVYMVVAHGEHFTASQRLEVIR
ncbi:MAG: PQQ-dependent sugar dehydrogenase [Bacteroidetes bacterium]|nr:PQQ-dependent sugar dehydrogenase [Bacteroidota bacterium]